MVIVSKMLNLFYDIIIVAMVKIAGILLLSNAWYCVLLFKLS